MATKVITRKANVRWQKIIPWIVLVFAAGISLWPMYWLFVTSVTPTTFSLKTPPDLIPIHASLSNFERLLNQASDYWTWATNSITVAIAITLFHIFFDTLAGYAFAKKKFPGRNIFFWIIISTMMIPAYVTLIPMYIVTQKLHLLNTLWSIILPGFSGVFGIFLMRQYIQTLPSE